MIAKSSIVALVIIILKMRRSCRGHSLEFGNKDKKRPHFDSTGTIIIIPGAFRHMAVVLSSNTDYNNKTIDFCYSGGEGVLSWVLWIV